MLFVKYSQAFNLNTKTHKVWVNHETQILKQVSTKDSTKKNQQYNHVITVTKLNSQSAVEKLNKLKPCNLQI